MSEHKTDRHSACRFSRLGDHKKENRLVLQKEAAGKLRNKSGKMLNREGEKLFSKNKKWCMIQDV